MGLHHPRKHEIPQNGQKKFAVSEVFWLMHSSFMPLNCSTQNVKIPPICSSAPSLKVKTNGTEMVESKEQLEFTHSGTPCGIQAEPCGGMHSNR